MCLPPFEIVLGLLFVDLYEGGIVFNRLAVFLLDITDLGDVLQSLSIVGIDPNALLVLGFRLFILLDLLETVASQQKDLFILNQKSLSLQILFNGLFAFPLLHESYSFVK